MTQHGSDGLRTLSSPVRTHLVEHLTEVAREGPTGADTPGRTAAELAEVTGLHVTTIRFHLEQLINTGFIEARFEHSPGAGRPRKVYSAGQTHLPEPTPGPHQHALAQLHAEVVSSNGGPAEAEEAGIAWAREHIGATDADPPGPARSAGTWLAQVGRIVDVLREWGYGPHLRTTGASVELTLHHCPLMSLATDQAQVVCAIHRGLMRGTLEAIGEDQVEIAVHPKVTATTCMVQVQTLTPLTDHPGSVPPR